ncbi:MAG: Fe-S cluster assembly protein SufD [Anaerolineae bacterium]|nr:Fe-S cluster assembly protein SufD [Anaerolineae bacterium]
MARRVVRRSKEALAAGPQVPYSRAEVEALSAQKGEPAWMAEKRLAAWDAFEALPWPDPTRDEPWRRTDYRHMRWHEATPRRSVNGVVLDDIPEFHRAPLIGETQGGMVAQVGDATVSRDIAGELAKAGVIFTDLDTAVREHGDLVREHFMTRAVLPDEDKFTALHAALWTHGVFLYVPRGVQVALPPHSVMWAPLPGATLGHVLVVVDEGAEVTYLHEYASPDVSEQALYVGATELIVKDNAGLKFVSLQEWGNNTYGFTHQRARVGRDARLDWVVGATGGHFTKDVLEIELDGRGSWTRMSGYYFAEKNQFFDLDTHQSHNAPNATSDVLFKGALKDASRTVWQGMIVVQPDAQKTDGFQANRNLMLSKTARADSIPGLEIKANDVRCTHAAALSRIEEEPVFYLMARGVSRAMAERLLIEGFFMPILDRIPFERVRERLLGTIDKKMEDLIGTVEFRRSPRT